MTAVRATCLTVDGHAGFGHRFGNVAAVDRTVELAAFAGLAHQGDGHAFQAADHLLRLFAALQVVGFELRTLLFEAGHVALGRPQRLFLRQEIVPRIARLDRHDVAHLPELFDALHQDHFHVTVSRLAATSRRREAAPDSAHA